MAGPLPIIGAGVSLLAKQFVKRKAKSAAKKANQSAADRIAAKVPKKNRELVRKRVREAERKVNASRAIDAKKHGTQDVSGLVKALKDPTSEAYKSFNKLPGFPSAKRNPKSPWKK